MNESTGCYVGEGWSMEELKLPIIQYVFVCNVSYYLGYGDDLSVLYTMAGTHKMQSLKIDYYEALRIKGKKISPEKYAKVSSLFRVKKGTKENE